MMGSEIMTSISRKLTLQAMWEASLDLFKLFCLGFKKDKNFWGVCEATANFQSAV